MGNLFRKLVVGKLVNLRGSFGASIIKLAGLTAGASTVTEVPTGDWFATYNTDGGILGTVLAQVVGNQTTLVQFGNAIPEPAGRGLLGVALLAMRKRRS